MLEPVGPALPQGALRREPCRGRGKRLLLESAGAHAAVLARPNQPVLLEKHREVPGRAALPLRDSGPSARGALGEGAATPARPPAERWGKVPKVYVFTKRDQAISPTLQQAMTEGVTFVKTVTLDTSHSPFLSDPELVKATLMGL